MPAKTSGGKRDRIMDDGKGMKIMSRRVVVTGMGAITPIGNSVEEFWQGLKSKKVGIGPITAFDTENYKVKLAAEVKRI